MKKKLIAIIMACLLICFSNVFISLADSGWDYSYDSGGSWDSGSSWDYDYDWDYDWDYDSGSDSSGGGGIILLILGLLLNSIPFIMLIMAIWSNKKEEAKTPEQKTLEYRKHLEKLKLNKESSTQTYNDMISKYPDFDKEKFLREAYNIYVGVQLAWSEFDYEKLRSLTTDELYNMYKMQLETLKIKNEKNVMRDFNKKFIDVININKVNGVFTVTVRLYVMQRDYVVNILTNELIRGDKNRICDVKYNLTFVSNVSKEVLNDCPNCGAPINNTASQRCEYCNSELVGNYNNDTWVLAKKENIGQRR